MNLGRKNCKCDLEASFYSKSNPFPGTRVKRRKSVYHGICAVRVCFQVEHKRISIPGE